MSRGLKFLLLVILTVIFSGCDELKEFLGQNNTATQTRIETNVTNNDIRENDIRLKPEDNITIDNGEKPDESQKTIRVACVGDSITLGVGIPSSTDTYPAQLSKFVGKGWEVRNFGVKSTTLLKSGSSPYWATNAYKNSKNYNPDIVIILLGTNDAKHGNWANKQHFITDYGALIESYKSLSSQPLVYICYPPTVKKGKYGISNGRILHEIIPRIKQVASIHSVEAVDLYQAFDNQNGLLGDDVHPNVKGAGVIANTVYKTIY